MLQKMMVFLCLWAAPVLAQKTALRAAQMLDVTTGTLVQNAVVLIDGERITAVGAGLAIPSDATVIDLGRRTILPGLIDCHTHLLASSANEYLTMIATKSQAYRALEGAANARKTLRAGFTAVRDVENEGSGYADVALRDAIGQGLVEGPRMKVSTRGIAVIGQYGPFGVSTDLPDFPHGAQMISGVEEARRAVREQLGNGADLIKIYADWAYPTLTVDEIRVIVEEAHKAGKRIAAHATTVEAIRNAITAGVDSIEHGDGADRPTLELMKEKGVWLVPTYAGLVRAMTGETPVDDDQRKRMNAYLEKKQTMIKTAREVGVRIANGYDSAEAETQGANAQELIALAEFLTPLGSIRAATIDAAELLGWQDRIGSLAPGKFADVIAVDGNPLADIKVLEHVSFVMKGGAVVVNPAAFAQKTAIRAAQMLDVTNGTLVQNAVVLIDGERITAVGAGLAIPNGATVIDLGRRTILPGLIDCHSHLLSSGTDEYLTMLATKSQAYRALDGTANARKTLRAGFTAVRDAESEGSGYADVALRDAIDQGLVEGPRMKVATRAIAVIGQMKPLGVSPDLPDFPRGAQMISGVEEVRRAVREQLGNGADLIKIFADWAYPTLTVDEMRVIVEEAHKAGKRVAAHATTIEAIRNAIAAGVDSIEHGDQVDRPTLELMKEKGVWLVPTYAALVHEMSKVTPVSDDRRKRMNAYLEKKQTGIKTAREIGVRIAIGYDSGEAETQGTNAQELIALAGIGLAPLESIRAATVDAAELLGWQDRIGSLAPGKFADVIAVDGNPLADIKVLERVSFVMKGGAVVVNSAAR